MKNTGPLAERSYRKCSFLLGLAVFTYGLSLPARGESDSNMCGGIDFDAKRPLVASRVTTRPHINFVKGSDDDAACPADKEVCRKKAFLVPGDVVMAADVILDSRRSDAVAKNSGLDRLLVSSQAEQSRFHFSFASFSRKAVLNQMSSAAQAPQGNAQFMPETASRVGLENPFDPMQAIAASARLLRDLVRQFGNLGLAAASYNAGPRRIQNWLARKGRLPDETQHYVKTITSRPADSWKAARTVTPLENVPHQAPCQEAAGVVASSATQLDQAATRTRTELARARAPAHRSAKRERSSMQLAAARNKKHQKLLLSQR
jgi:Transglycosylase SLT domain